MGYIRDGRTQLLPFGRLEYEEDSAEVKTDTVYDVASITKSIPTSSIILKLTEDRRLGLDDRLIDYVPEVQNQYRDQILIRHLLSFTVAFDIGGPLAEIAQSDPEHLLERLTVSPLLARPGERFMYTNAPSIFLGLVAERVTKRPLDELADEMFFGPLGMTRTTFDPKFRADEVAPSEEDWRGRVQLEPHDENAWVLRRQGIVAGNAALFSTAPDLLRFAQMLLNKGGLDGRRYFKPETVRLMHTNQTAYLGETTGLGWELNWPLVMGSNGSGHKFGKTGFTGCIIIIDPETQTAFVLLSNRLYPKRAPSRQAINAFRRDLANIILG